MTENWITSSYTTAAGNCVEVAGAWKTSSYSASGANCIEAAGSWKKSSRSYTQETCVETATCSCGIKVRDTKDRQRGHFTVSAAAWSAFLTLARQT